MKILRAVLAFAVPASFAFVPAASFAAPDSRVAALIKESGSALHVSAMQSIRVVHLKGTFVNTGLHGTNESWNEIGGVRTSSRFSTPPLAGGSGWDGHDNWSLDQTGLVIVDASDGGRSATISQAFISNDDLWKPNLGGASVTWEGTKNDKGKAYDVLGVTAPGSKLPIDVWFDKTTHLPMRTVQADGPIVSTVTFANYRPVHGLMVPFAVDSNIQGNETAFTATAADANPTVPAGQLTKPTSNPHDFSITNGATQATVPIQLSNNHIYLDVMLNGKGPYHFVFDTGGANIVDPAVAAEIGASSNGSAQVGGFGNSTQGSSFAVVKSLQIGDATVRDQVFLVLPVRKEFGLTASMPADGLIGYEVLSRFVTTFAYGDNALTFHMPGAYRAPAGASVIPITQNGTQPQFACTIDRVPTVCTLDTGANNSLSFYAPFLKAHPQVIPDKLSAEGVNGFGVGGPTLGKLGRTQTLAFGSFTLPNLVGDYTTQTEGGSALPFLGANIGGAVLKRFTMTLDYDALTMTLTPNDAYSTPDVSDRSGMYLINPGAITIYSVRAGTPAAAAGLTKGEVITSVNGSPPTTLGSIRETLIGKPGDVVHLVVKNKDGTTRNVDLTLADYV